MNDNEWYKLFFLLGGLFFAAGLLFYVFRNSGFPLGKWPGDFIFEHKNLKIYFPLVTSILISIILSLILYLLRK